MKDSREVAFLDWFAKQTPRRPAPMSGMGPNVPGLPKELSDRPDIEMPSSALDLSKIGTGVPPEPAAAFPAPGSALPTTPPAESATSAGDKSGETKSTPPASDTTKPPESGEKK